ncbi:MAG: hypothetical protein ACRC2V_27390 [Xenococcaceae cyanobacterium]
MTHDKVSSLQIEVRLDVALSKVRRLSAQQREIVCTLHERPGLCNKEIARYCFASEQTIASQLAIIEKTGVISKTKLETKGDRHRSFWRICDQEISDLMTFKNMRPGQFIGWNEEGCIN